MIWSIITTHIFKLFVYLGYRISGFSQIKIGKCAFRGPETFLNRCKSAMAKLQLEDGLMYAKLIQMNGAIFYYHKKSYNGPAQLYFISDEYCSWSDHGIITRVVHACLREEIMCRRAYIPRSELIRINVGLENMMYQWLIKHKYPVELISLYGGNHKEVGPNC